MSEGSIKHPPSCPSRLVGEFGPTIHFPDLLSASSSNYPTCHLSEASYLRLRQPLNFPHISFPSSHATKRPDHSSLPPNTRQ